MNLCIKKQAFENCGHFQLHDEPDKIIQTYIQQNTIYFQVQWKKNKNRIPNPTLYSSKQLRQFNSQLLLDYYQQNLDIVLSNLANNQNPLTFPKIQYIHQENQFVYGKGSTIIKQLDSKDFQSEYNIQNLYNLQNSVDNRIKIKEISEQNQQRIDLNNQKSKQNEGNIGLNLKMEEIFKQNSNGYEMVNNEILMRQRQNIIRQQQNKYQQKIRRDEQVSKQKIAKDNLRQLLIENGNKQLQKTCNNGAQDLLQQRQQQQNVFNQHQQIIQQQKQNYIQQQKQNYILDYDSLINQTQKNIQIQKYFIQKIYKKSNKKKYPKSKIQNSPKNKQTKIIPILQQYRGHIEVSRKKTSKQDKLSPKTKSLLIPTKIQGQFQKNKSKSEKNKLIGSNQIKSGNGPRRSPRIQRSHTEKQKRYNKKK